MTEELLTDDDRAAIAARGLASEDVDRQLAILRSPPPYTRLLRACTPGDGIHVLSESAAASALEPHAEAAPAGRFLCFVPASGAATRMFRAPLAVLERDANIDRQALDRLVAGGDKDAREVAELVDALDRFAFTAALAAAMQKRGDDLATARRSGDVAAILGGLLRATGLDYASLPKGLLAFHRYGTTPRTAFEEHLVDAAEIARDAGGDVRLHFTVSEHHLAGFEALLQRVRSGHESALAAHFAISFSHQAPSTDTVAVDGDGRPFRDADGKLLFRPGGHGALLANLGRCDADVAFVKNIDNVVPDHLKGPVVHWKKVLGGLLVQLQDRVCTALRRLEDDASPAAVDAGIALLASELDTPAPAELASATPDTRLDWVQRKLARPLRVCGMVRNEGETGGGPFWVGERRRSDATGTPQIVETAQIDLGDDGQKRILAASTHFNPVDLVCALRDHHGRPYDLARHVDPEAVFLSEKSSGGRKLRALERPGLWNGSMADWNTVFVDVPASTFNPVKTVNDLLRPQHQPPDDAR